MPHAENGIGELAKELLLLVARHPNLLIYLPHLGWPRRDERDDPDWHQAITELGQCPNIVAGASAIAHFSAQPFPHLDVEPFAAHLIQTFGSSSVVIGSDYPLFEKEHYGRYLELARRWAFGANLQTALESESVLCASAAS